MLHRTPPAVRTRAQGAAAFTLVELLVVIGIIALLIAILLPTLSAARKQAAAVKCGAHLREIGNCFQMYAHDNRGYYPPASWQGGPYNLYGDNGTSWIWNSFLQKYATSARQGTASMTVDEATAARNTIFWGCPAWEGYATTALGGYDRTGIGYGMNPYPTFEFNTPVESGGAVYNDDMPSLDVRALIRLGGRAGGFMKQIQWSRPAERALVADSINWRIKAQPEPPEGTLVGQPTPDRIRTFSGFKRNQTLVDVYRHGTKPGLADASTFQAKGGKVKYNILYCDGHVETHTLMKPAYYTIRFGNPGNN